MPSIQRLFARDTDKPADDGSDNLINLMLVILGIVFLALILISILFFFRRARRLQMMRAKALDDEEDGLPSYYDAKPYGNNHRGLTIETKHNGRSSILVINRDNHPMLANPNSPPHSPDNVPEIHITFPDEQDDQGRPKSGRVLVVRVGDNATVGMEPMNDEQLPAYEKEAKGQFYSIDMNQIGGLKEKDRSQFQ
ncbi:hypothetical protein B0T10DRAFT_557073 [Thelonectria olida]|uniref:Uncharacterized protein n=1 Tax=Thelonectria olida TaxID=1576542 RepID=A0A9P8WE49_9HYPO|nr:hypothetical protein B0T10DRAFT_557073 [Thelonectria olida]